jgi:hypothetical protein
MVDIRDGMVRSENTHKQAIGSSMSQQVSETQNDWATASMPIRKWCCLPCKTVIPAKSEFIEDARWNLFLAAICTFDAKSTKSI